MKYDIAVVMGDGIGPEVCSAAIEVLKAVPGLADKLAFREYPAGAEHFRKTGDAFPESTFEGCRDAHAILHGAAGLPGVTYPDGTEAGLDFGLQLRFRLDLYANVRPIKLHPGVVGPLRRFKANQIDYVILRENTEGLYASRGSGTNLRGEVASDTLLVTRKGVERISKMAFELARKRNGAPRDGKRRVTLCDKANVLRSYAFFRKVFTEVAAGYPDIEVDYSMVDAMTVHLDRTAGFLRRDRDREHVRRHHLRSRCSHRRGHGHVALGGARREQRLLPGIARLGADDRRQEPRESARDDPVGRVHAALARRAPPRLPRSRAPRIASRARWRACWRAERG